MRVDVHIDSIVLGHGLELTHPERAALADAVAREIGLRLRELPGRAGSTSGPVDSPLSPLPPASRARVDHLGASVADAVHQAIGPLSGPGHPSTRGPRPPARAPRAPR